MRSEATEETENVQTLFGNFRSYGYEARIKKNILQSWYFPETCVSTKASFSNSVSQYPLKRRISIY